MNAPSLDRRAFLATAGAFTLSFTVADARAQQAGTAPPPWSA